MDDLEVVKWVDGLANGNPRVAHTGGVKSNSSSDSSRVAFRFCVMNGRIARDRLQARGGRQRQRRRRQEQTRVKGGTRAAHSNNAFRSMENTQRPLGAALPPNK
jgi:hypothetical protein